MAIIEVTVPALGESVTEATIARWAKGDGEQVAADETIAELETDKALMELPAPAAGRLQVLVPEGETVTVGQVIARIDTEAAGAAATPPAAEPSGPPTPEPAPPSTPEPEPVPEPAPAPKVNPAAARLIAEHGLDATQIPATGKGGRITKGDVLAYLERQREAAPPAAPAAPAPPAPAPAPSRAKAGEPEEERVPMTRIRKRIAERLVEAQRTAAILTTFNDVDLGAVIEARKRYRERFEERHGVRLGFMSFFAKAVCLALAEQRELNAFIEGDEIVYHRHVHLGIAVGTERGLVVPVVRYADTLSIPELERAIAELARKARANRITPDDLVGGTFSISNGGVYGSLLSTPILNPPQSGILGMHRIEERPVVRDGEIVVRPMMYLALSYDHRIVDGEQAVTFLRRVKEYLEDPVRMLLEL